jgi:hypothetical protein
MSDKAYSRHLIDQLRRAPSAAVIAEVLEYSNHEGLPTELTAAGKHTDERRRAYFFTDTLHLTQGRADVGYFIDTPGVTTIFGEGEGDEDDRHGFVHERTFEGWLAYSRGSDLFIQGVGRTPREAIADADLNLINEHFINNGERAPFIGLDTCWVICGLDEQGELEVALLPQSLVSSKDSALDMAGIPNAEAVLAFVYVAEIFCGCYSGYASNIKAAESLINFVARPQ